MTSFTLHVPDAALDDLRARLSRTRLPDRPPPDRPGPGSYGADPWALGTDVAYLSTLLDHWQHGFDWRAEEAALNAFPQLTVPVAGPWGSIDVHCLHVPGQGPDPRPLLLCHGWPGSVFEFLDIIPRLTDPARFGRDPARSFTVVAPSLPGYGLSFRPGQPRFGLEEMADAMAGLMTALGYNRFMAQGGDWGAFVTSRLAFLHPERVEGLHLNMLPVPRTGKPGEGKTPEEEAHLDRMARWLREETGYQSIQGTKPQTLAFALTDSPAGLAAWHAEKFHSWSDNDGTIESAIPRNRMLANICLYWFTAAIGSSFHPYYSRLHRPWPIPPGQTVDVPTAYADFPREMLKPPRSVAAPMFPDIRRWTPMPRGGHFAALEQPELLADDIAAFAAILQTP